MSSNDGTAVIQSYYLPQQRILSPNNQIEKSVLLPTTKQHGFICHEVWANSDARLHVGGENTTIPKVSWQFLTSSNLFSGGFPYQAKWIQAWKHRGGKAGSQPANVVPRDDEFTKTVHQERPQCSFSFATSSANCKICKCIVGTWDMPAESHIPFCCIQANSRAESQHLRLMKSVCFWPVTQRRRNQNPMIVLKLIPKFPQDRSSKHTTQSFFLISYPFISINP